MKVGPGVGEGFTPGLGVLVMPGIMYGATVTTPGLGDGVIAGAGVGTPPGNGVGFVKSQNGTWQQGFFGS